MEYTEEQLQQFSFDYFTKVDHMPPDHWYKLPLRTKQEHFEKMKIILSIVPSKLGEV